MPKNSLIVRWFDSRIEKIKHSNKKLPNYPTTQLPNFRSAFTLIELLVVISIIAILVAAATASWTNAQKKSRDGKRKSDLKSIQQALELYFQNNGFYPLSGDTNGLNALQCNIPSPLDKNYIGWGQNFSCGTGTEKISYMNPVPKDPIQNAALKFIYYYEAPDTNHNERPLKYTLSANLENEKDQDRCDKTGPFAGPEGCKNQSKLPCQPAANFNYCVVNP